MKPLPGPEIIRQKSHGCSKQRRGDDGQILGIDVQDTQGLIQGPGA